MRPKVTLERPKSTQMRPQSASIVPPSVARNVFAHNAAGARLWQRFFVVVCVEHVPCEVCFDPMKLWFGPIRTVVLAYYEHVGRACLLACVNFEK